MTWVPRQVGVAATDALDPASWSGTPASLVRGLGEAGAQVVTLDTSVPGAVARLLQGWLSLTGRLDDSWSRSPVFARAAEQSSRMRRLIRHRGPVDAWILLGSHFGIPVDEPFATFDDMTVAQARSIADFRFNGMDGTRWDAWQARQARLYGEAKKCLVASAWAARSVVDDYGVPPAKVDVVGCGRNLDPSPAPRDWLHPRFLFVGREWERKNGPALVHAFAQLRAEVPDAMLEVVGDHPRIDVAGVIGHGPMQLGSPTDRAALCRLFERATCFVMPSRFEPFGIAYAEAAAAGIASIATSMGGAADIVGDDGGILVDPGDERALLTGMRLMSDPERARVMGAAAQARAPHFTWAAVGQRVLDSLFADVSEGPIIR
jgi:glycosyltransferase involved in cell wall biosynthesis